MTKNIFSNKYLAKIKAYILLYNITFVIYHFGADILSIQYLKVIQFAPE